MKRLLIVLGILLIPSMTFALTPIARWDVVPYQRLSYPDTLNLGVVAFSKAGIDNVAFTISGQGYSGGVLTATSSTYNSQSRVWEYWVPLTASAFTTNGPFTVQATVTGGDAGTRDVGTLSFVVDHDNTTSHPFAVVKTSGDDGTGVVDDPTHPYATVAEAAGDIQSAYGDCDGATIYIDEDGDYTLGTKTVTTADEWFTITRGDNATKAGVNIVWKSNSFSGKVNDTDLLKIDGITLQGSGSSHQIFGTYYPMNLWVNDSVMRGDSELDVDSNSVWTITSYYTDVEVTNCGRAFLGGVMARNVFIHHIGEDAFQNFPFIVNARVDDIDPQSTGWHSDLYQWFGLAGKNVIVYGMYGTNLHYEGMLFRQRDNLAENIALVNVFLSAPKGHGPSTSIGIGVWGIYEHLLMWNCTVPPPFGVTLNNEPTTSTYNITAATWADGKISFTTATGPGYVSVGTRITIAGLAPSALNGIQTLTDIVDTTHFKYSLDDPGTITDQTGTTTGANGFTNSSLVGNVMYVYSDGTGTSGVDPPEFANGNSENNEALYNHYYGSRIDSGMGWNALTFSPDSGSPATQTIGEGVLDLSYSSHVVTFGLPTVASGLRSRIPFAKIPMDINRVARGSSSTVGAVEFRPLTIQSVKF